MRANRMTNHPHRTSEQTINRARQLRRNATFSGAAVATKQPDILTSGAPRPTPAELRKQCFACFEPGREYSTANIVDALHRVHGKREGDPVLNQLHKLEKDGLLEQTPTSTRHCRVWKLIGPTKATKSKSKRPIYAEDRDYTKTQLDNAVRNNSLRFRNVQTSNRKAAVRQRVGQDAVRRGTLENYAGFCAICDVSDERLLRASHIKGWAECEESSGDLGNVMCLCVFHDALFENGYWSLNDQFGIVVRSDDIECHTIRDLLPDGCSFRKPSWYQPALDFIRHHRTKHGLRSS